jgi:hypothetical protein
MQKEYEMGATNLLKKAKPVNMREAQAQLPKLIRAKCPCKVFSHGKPVSFLVSYEDMMDILETLDELEDQQLLREVKLARKEYAIGKSVPAESLFKKLGF